MVARRYLPVIAVTVLLLCIFSQQASWCAVIREPAWAGKFYPDTKSELKQSLNRLFDEVDWNRKTPFSSDELRALIMPHAGYAYSGITAAHAAATIVRDGFDRVVLLGPDHRVGFSNASLTGASHWKTPLGVVPIGDARQLLKSWPDLFHRIAASDQSEHSIEVILPFLQTRLSHFEAIPVVVGPCDAKKMARALEPLLRDKRTLLVVSADLSHYLPYDEAVKRDRKTLDRILSLDPNWHLDQENRTCGRFPLGVLLELAGRHHWRPVELYYNNSGDTAGDKDAVVGYGAVAFYGDETMRQPPENSRALTSEQGEALVALARQTLAAHFDAAVAQTKNSHLADQALQARCGTFVTLKIDNQLRGCIGSLSTASPIVSDVRNNALNAAFHDPRFPPLSKSELEQVRIEVSVLTEPVPLTYKDVNDLLSRLRPGIDGVIVRKGSASATFLPQVWEQLPQTGSFLSHLCMKAGLACDQWRAGDVSVEVYQVQYFEEER